MNYFDLVKARASYRGKYSDTAVSEEDLELILTAGLVAPSGCNSQSTEFVVIRNTDIIEEISRIIGMEKMGTAPVMVLCIVNKVAKAVVHDHSFEIEDCSAAVMSMLLAITELGYLSVWIDGELRYEHKAERIGALINLPEDKKIQILFPVGKADVKVRQPAKKDLRERVSYESYTL